eukprot:10267271-Alexandrium_andersonii.AAC.1
MAAAPALDAAHCCSRRSHSSSHSLQCGSHCPSSASASARGSALRRRGSAAVDLRCICLLGWSSD